MTVEPINEKGFRVELAINDREFMVSSDFWHEHFDKEEEDKALNCFAFMLSDACRLRIEYRGQRPVTWTVESLKNGEWIGDSTTGLFDLRFWKEKRVKYFQNNLLRREE